MKQQIKQKQKGHFENSFHPLDLSPSDFLVIFKRFQESSLINKNPKPQLSIEIIAQIISSLKGCRPSQIQKIMTQALVKDTISYQDFLLFVDHQSQVRAQILQWLLHEKNTKKYQYNMSFPIRNRILKHYQSITFMKVIKFGDKILLLMIFDRRKTFLVQVQGHKMNIIDEFLLYNSKSSENIYNGNSSCQQQNSKLMQKSMKYPQNRNRKIMNQSNRIPNKKYQLDFSMPKITAQNWKDIGYEPQQYFLKEKDNINGVFQLFKEMPIEQATKIARFGAKRISERNLTATNVNELRQVFNDVILQKPSRVEKAVQFKPLNPIQQAGKKLRSLSRQKNYLSYNPYTGRRTFSYISDEFQQEQSKHQLKKEKNRQRKTFDRKGKQYLQQSMFQYYCEQLRCLVLAFYSMEVVLVRISQQFNKIVLQQQDSIKVSNQRDNKKNENVEAVCIHFHSITSKWIMLVLIRTTLFKSEYRTQMHSVLRGFQIQVSETRNNQSSYKFKNRHELFSIQLEQQAISMFSHPSRGLHFISNDGTYVFFKQQYRFSQESTVYFQQAFTENFKQSKFSLCCVHVHSEANKVIFGTFNGKIIIYDLFSKQYKVTKISNNQIIQIQTKNNLVYLLAADHKIHIYDIYRKQQVQLLDVRNQEKLHQKIHFFDILDHSIYCYGTQVKKYTEFQDQQLIHQTRKIKKQFNWRLNKLQQNQKNLKKQPPKSAITYRFQNNSELVIQSNTYFIILSEILQVVLINKQAMKISFTMILPIPFDSKVMKMALSNDQKLLCLLLFDQSIYIFNIYTQELFIQLNPSIKQKFSTISFLDDKNQYLLAAGTENGSISLISYPCLPQRQPKILTYHKNAVTLTCVVNNYMITSAEDKTIAIWVLPFNVLKHEIKLSVANYISDNICAQGQNVYLRTINGKVFQVNVKEGRIKSNIKQPQGWTVCAFDYCTDQFFGIKQAVSSSQLVILKRNKQTNIWECKMSIKLTSKSKVVHIGVLPTEKAVLFYEAGEYITFNYQNNSLSKIAVFNN